MKLLNNSSGQPSGSWTMTFISFCVITLWLLVSIIDKIGHLYIRPFDSSQAMGYFIPIASLYFGRRFTDARFNNSDQSAPQDNKTT